MVKKRNIFSTSTPTERNECGVITIFPMSVICNSTNPSSTTSTDGIASLIITGGTYPYDIQWDNGGIGDTITNLSIGTYTATIKDYYNDFQLTQVCVLSATTTPTPTPSPTPTPVPELYDFCLNFTIIN